MERTWEATLLRGLEPVWTDWFPALYKSSTTEIKVPMRSREAPPIFKHTND